MTATTKTNSTQADIDAIEQCARRSLAACRALGVCDPTIVGLLIGATAFARKGTPYSDITAAEDLAAAGARWRGVWAGEIGRTLSGREQARRRWGAEHDRSLWGDLGLALDARVDAAWARTSARGAEVPGDLTIDVTDVPAARRTLRAHAAAAADAAAAAQIAIDGVNTHAPAHWDDLLADAEAKLESAWDACEATLLLSRAARTAADALPTTAAERQRLAELRMSQAAARRNWHARPPLSLRD